MKCSCDHDVQDINHLCPQCRAEYVEWSREQEELFEQMKFEAEVDDENQKTN